jgi:hypothetical protein
MMSDFIAWVVFPALISAVVVFFLVYWVAGMLLNTDNTDSARPYKWSCPEPDCPLEVATSHVELLDNVIEDHRKQDHS